MAYIYLKVAVIMAVFCTVNAAITVNIYEDDPNTVEKSVAHEVEDCNLATCNRMCRLLGFKKGNCAGDTCVCSKYTVDDDQLETNEISGHDEETTETLNDCNPNACDQLCRRLQFPGGACINGRCKCDNFRQESDQLDTNATPRLDEEVTGEDLNDKFRQEPDENELTPGNRCNANVCSEICHRLGFHYGVCIGEICRCSNIRSHARILDQNDVKERIENSFNNDVDSVTIKSKNIYADESDCDQLACMMGCTELGYPGGSCFMDKCRCNSRGKEEILRLLRACSSVTCNMMCVRLKYNGGWCRFGRCECF